MSEVFFVTGEAFCKSCDRDEQYLFCFHVSQFLRLKCQKGLLGSSNLDPSCINRISPSNFCAEPDNFFLQRYILLAALCFLMVIDLSVLYPALKNALFRGRKSTLCFLSEQNELLCSAWCFSSFSIARNFCIEAQGISGSIFNCQWKNPIDFR